MKRFVWLSLLAWLPTALAADQATAKPDAMLAFSCMGCHQVQPTGDQHMPSLTGLTQPQVAAKLRAYRDDTLPGTLMNRIAKGYTDTEIQQLAEYFGAPQP